MKHFPSLNRLGEGNVLATDKPLVIQEKVDGANFRFTINEEGELIFGSRNVVWEDERDQNKQFRHAIDYVEENINEGILNSDVTVFCEALHKHTIDYDWGNIPNVVGYSVWDSAEHGWVHPNRATNYIESMGIPVVPVVEMCSKEYFRDHYITDDGIDREALVPESEYYDGKAEGVVINAHQGGELHRAKVRTEEFLEKHKGSKKSNEHPETDEDKLVNTYCTPARVEKTAHKLIDEGKWDSLCMPMMEDLAPRMVKDIWEEEWEEIVFKHWELDMGDVRSGISSRTASYLKDAIEKEI